MFGSLTTIETGAYTLRAFGRPVVEGYFGGAFARALEGEISAFAIEQIVNALGHDMRKRLSPLAESAWAHDPFSLGAYSYGSADAARDAHSARGAGQRETVLRRRALFAARFLDRAWRVPHGRDGGRRGDQSIASSAGVTAARPWRRRAKVHESSPGRHARHTSGRSA